MGGNESTGRKVSFGLDEEDRVRVLRGVRLSDDVVSRMKESSQLAKEQSSPTASTTAPSPVTRTASGRSRPPGAAGPSAHHPTDSSGYKPTVTEEDLYRRYEREQAIIQDELVRLAKRELEAAEEKVNLSILRERTYTKEERQKAAQLVKELECKEAELKRLDAFHKEQLARIEKKNAEIYKLTSEQFHTAATNAELRIKKRNFEPLCMGLQAEILKCYQKNKQEVLNCSDLAKEYRQCVRAAQKDLLVNHG
ncbi:MICOS complex subunit MIC25 isoform X2 [Rhinatrema bivittatum]|uniref:MICOS complex subunit MIC25 isoform X2 n=1 Tax=Rhinatrema bivittatum TaxID=194408 RepID=UPI001126EE02|nr:MICOS complex subunit MIC25 isoform X2 [Rhinatrema bivittatum]